MPALAEMSVPKYRNRAETRAGLGFYLFVYQQVNLRFET